MNDTRPLSIPVLLGTPRHGRLSEYVARLMVEQLTTRADVHTTLIDVRELSLSSMDAGEQIKDARFSDRIMRADGLVIVAPEYNHGYPGILKHALDTNLKEYIHKAVGLCGVSAGGFGGTRVVESLLPVLRELGMVAIYWDVNVSSAGKAFDAEGQLLDLSLPRRIDKMLGELIWMARVLRYGREMLDVGPGMTCPACAATMNQHARKLDFSTAPQPAQSGEPELNGVVQEVHQCPNCGNVELRPAAS